jgi:hypothetical protein
MANRFITVPIAFDLVSVFVERATAVTMGKHIRVVILKGFLGHIWVIL